MVHNHVLHYITIIIVFFTEVVGKNCHIQASTDAVIISGWMTTRVS